MSLQFNSPQQFSIISWEKFFLCGGRSECSTTSCLLHVLPAVTVSQQVCLGVNASCVSVSSSLLLPPHNIGQTCWKSDVAYFHCKSYGCVTGGGLYITRAMGVLLVVGYTLQELWVCYWWWVIHYKSCGCVTGGGLYITRAMGVLLVVGYTLQELWVCYWWWVIQLTT